MANPKHLDILKQGVEAWNSWRHKNKGITPDLSSADLREEYLKNVNLSKANLRRSILSGTILSKANLTEANLQNANLQDAILDNASMRGINFKEANLSGATLRDSYMPEAILSNANLSKAVLSNAILSNAKLVKAELKEAYMDHVDLGEANLSRANLESAHCSYSDFSKANLKAANLHRARLDGTRLYWTLLNEANLTNSVLVGAVFIETDLENADISGSWIYGISVWNANLKGCAQRDLTITSSHADNAMLAVDSLEVAQFIYLLLHYEKFRDVIDSITAKAVLILGRFTEERKVVLVNIRDELRNRGYIPVLFDFEKPGNRDLTETIMTLAGMARFVIADLSDPNSIPGELMSFGEKLISVPIQAIFCPVPGHEWEYPMFEHLARYPHVLPIYRYDNQAELIAVLSEKVIEPAEAKVKEMQPKNSS